MARGADRLLLEGRRLLGRPPAVGAEGVPSAQALAGAREKMGTLTRRDSVRLTADEMAALLEAGLEPPVRRQLDSIRVRLRDGGIEVGARLATGRLPADLVGPLGMALHEREPIRAAGPVRMVEPGEAEWEIREFQLRDFPFPRDVVPRLVEKALGDSTRGAVPVHLPRGIRAVRIAPDAVTLFGATPP